MLFFMQSFRAKLHTMQRREDGSSTVEFVLLYPLFMLLFLMSIELGVLMTRSAMLDHAVEVSMRGLRLGTLKPMTHDSLKASICSNAMIFPNCENTLLVELIPTDKLDWSKINQKTKCFDRTATIDPVIEFQAGSQNKMVLVRACAIFDPLFPTTGLAASMKLDKSGAYALVVGSAYVNEP